MSRWFRMHDEILDDPKVQRLSGDDFKGWVNILCLASRNDGKLPPIEDVAFALRETLDGARTLVERLVNATLIERRTGGSNGAHYAPYKWDERQYKSDTSTGRVKRFRQRSKTVPETPPDTETETDIPLSKDNGAAPGSDKHFWDTAKAYVGKSNSSLIGKWLKLHGKAETARAITAAQIERAADPVTYIQGYFRKRGESSGEMPC